MPPLLELDAGLRRLFPEDFPGRPFICDGSPFDCAVALVGINPATPTPFWPFWNVDTGFDRHAWIAHYLKLHGRFKPTRARIELFNRLLEPHKCIELNVFAHFTSNERELTPSQRNSEVFKYLLKSVKPRVLVLHGQTASIQLGRLLGIRSFKVNEFTRTESNGAPVDILLCKRHFSRASYSYVEHAAALVRLHLRSH